MDADTNVGTDADADGDSVSFAEITICKNSQICKNSRTCKTGHVKLDKKGENNETIIMAYALVGDNALVGGM